MNACVIFMFGVVTRRSQDTEGNLHECLFVFEKTWACLHNIVRQWQTRSWSKQTQSWGRLLPADTISRQTVACRHILEADCPSHVTVPHAVFKCGHKFASMTSVIRLLKDAQPVIVSSGLTDSLPEPLRANGSRPRKLRISSHRRRPSRPVTCISSRWGATLISPLELPSIGEWKYCITFQRKTWGVDRVLQPWRRPLHSLHDLGAIDLQGFTLIDPFKPARKRWELFRFERKPWQDIWTWLPCLSSANVWLTVNVHTQ